MRGKPGPPVDPKSIKLAKRGQGNYLTHYGLPEYWKYYNKNVQYSKFISKFADSTNLKVSEKVYKQIISEFFESLAQKLLQGEVLELPLNLGNISIKKQKIDFTRIQANIQGIDWGTFRKTGIKTKYLNDHTDGYKHKFIWDKSRCKVRTKTYYFYLPTRKNKRALAKILKTKGNTQDYLEKMPGNFNKSKFLIPKNDNDSI